MNRAHVNEHYTAYLEGALPESLRRAVEAHLLECPRCADELAAMRLLVDDLHQLPAVAPPADLAAGVRARLAARPQPRVRFWRLPLFAGGLATATLAVMLVLMRMNPLLFQAERQSKTPLFSQKPSTEQSSSLKFHNDKTVPHKISAVPAAKANDETLFDAKNQDPFIARWTIQPMNTATNDEKLAPKPKAPAQPLVIAMLPPQVDTGIRHYDLQLKRISPNDTVTFDKLGVTKHKLEESTVRPDYDNRTRTGINGATPAEAGRQGAGGRSDTVTWANDGAKHDNTATFGAKSAATPLDTYTNASPAATAPAPLNSADKVSAPPHPAGSNAAKPETDGVMAHSTVRDAELTASAPSMRAATAAPALAPAAPAGAQGQPGAPGPSGLYSPQPTAAVQSGVPAPAPANTPTTTPAPMMMAKAMPQTSVSMSAQSSTSLLDARALSSVTILSQSATGGANLNYKFHLAQGDRWTVTNTVEAMTTSAPETHDQAVWLRVNGDVPVDITVHTIQPKAREQKYTLTPTARDVKLDVPSTEDGAALKLRIRSGKSTETLYMIAPGTRARQAAITLRVTRRPAYRPLMQLATDAGLYLFCPAKFAERRISFSTAEKTPSAALNELLQKQRQQLTLSGSIGNISPGK